MDYIDVFVGGALTVLGLYIGFLILSTAWRMIVAVVVAAKRSMEQIPNVLEEGARSTGKATKQLSAFGRRVRQAFSEGRDGDSSDE